MINQDIRDIISDRNPNVLVFDDPAFDNSIIGLDANTDVAIYSMSLMIKELAEDDKISDEDACEFIEYNTLRTLPYMEASVRPIIVDDFMFIGGE